MRIAMFGTGYVGLVSGACFSDFGHVVTCIDKDAEKIRTLQSGKLPIFEPGLDALVARSRAPVLFEQIGNGDSRRRCRIPGGRYALATGRWICRSLVCS